MKPYNKIVNEMKHVGFFTRTYNENNENEFVDSIDWIQNQIIRWFS